MHACVCVCICMCMCVRCVPLGGRGPRWAWSAPHLHFEQGGEGLVSPMEHLQLITQHLIIQGHLGDSVPPTPFCVIVLLCATVHPGVLLCGSCVAAVCSCVAAVCNREPLCPRNVQRVYRQHKSAAYHHTAIVSWLCVLAYQEGVQSPNCVPPD
jgi:hypothetical protein